MMSMQQQQLLAIAARVQQQQLINAALMPHIAASQLVEWLQYNYAGWQQHQHQQQNCYCYCYCISPEKGNPLGANDRLMGRRIQTTNTLNRNKRLCQHLTQP